MGVDHPLTLLLSLSSLLLYQRSAAQGVGHTINTTANPSSHGERNLAGTCNIYRGRWVRDNSTTLYDSNCPFIDPGFNCIKHGRTDTAYLNYRWKPPSCNLQRFTGATFLRRWRRKKIMFVGDSLSQNQFQSLACMILAGVPRAKYEIIKAGVLTTIIFKGYETRLMLYRTPYLVDMVRRRRMGTLLILDSIRQGQAWRGMDVLVFNTGHWWAHKGAAQPWNYLKEKKRYYRDMNRLIAFYKGLTTWARWVDANVDPSKTRVFFQGLSPTHYMGKDWNQPSESCEAQRVPFAGDRYPGGVPPEEVVLGKVLGRIRKPVTLLDITALSEYRVDAHPAAHSRIGVDCSHWCLPGLPDTWNQLLYTALSS